MSHHELTNDDALRAVCKLVGREQPGFQWTKDLVKAINIIRAADEKKRGDRDFQEWLWEDSRIAGVGQGTIPIGPALDNEKFRLWLAAKSMEPLPASAEDRLRFLTALYEDLKRQLRPLLGLRMPHLKIFRVIAALYPEAMTVMASKEMLKELVEMMGGRHLPPVERHLWVRWRLDGLLGNPGNDPTPLALRISLPWLLYEHVKRAPSAVA
jgi:5-methylcytosine-specific restriction protein B